jgi:hypothetical protein
MGTTAMGMDIVTEASSHQVIPMAPNMCITPCAPSPIPMPYPLMGTSSELDPGTEKTQESSKKIMSTGCKVKQVHGNEPGTQKDITTMQTTGHAWGLPVMVTILFEGKPIATTANPGFMNSM